MEIRRDLYLKRLAQSRHNGMIKVVTGIVNRNYIFRLSVPKPQIVLATPMLQHKFILPVSKEALKQLKRDMEEHLLVV